VPDCKIGDCIPRKGERERSRKSGIVCVEEDREVAEFVRRTKHQRVRGSVAYSASTKNSRGSSVKEAIVIAAEAIATKTMIIVKNNRRLNNRNESALFYRERQIYLFPR